MFRVTIREILLLTVLVAMGVAWWLDHKQLSRQKGETAEELANAYQIIKKDDRDNEKYKIQLGRLRAAHYELTILIQRKSDSLTIQDIQDAVAIGVKDADARTQKAAEIEATGRR